MDIIKITIEYTGEITINNEYTTKGPLEMSWFPRNDLTLEANGIKRVINCDKTLNGGAYKLPNYLFE